MGSKVVFELMVYDSFLFLLENFEKKSYFMAVFEMNV